MKTTLLFLIAFSTLSTNAQYAFQLLEGNNVSATINNSGSQFTTVEETAGYLVPQNANTGLIYSAQFWYAGVDEESMLRAALGGDFYETDVFIGPYSVDYSDPSYSQEFAQSIFSFCRSEIQYFVTWWECQNGILTEGCNDMEIPSLDFLERIYSYPAHGNVKIGQEYWLLPFWDRDGDGVYNPDNGDFPIIKGCCATYLIQNDTRDLHSSGALPIGLQMVYHFYQYSNEGTLDDVTFIDVQTVNKGMHNFPEFRYGLLLDGDVGFPFDDYMGTDSLRQMAFFYNSDNYDEDDIDLEMDGFGLNPPALGLIALKEEVNSITPVSTGFNTVYGKWMNLGGLQSSSLPFTNPDGNPSTFIFSGSLDSLDEWTEVNSESVPGDRNLLMSSIVNNFQVGDTISQTYAILYSRIGNNLENAMDLKPRADEVRDFYLNGQVSQCEVMITGLDEPADLAVTVFPNPSTGEFQIFSSSAFESLEIRDINGRELFKRTHIGAVESIINIAHLENGIYSLLIRSAFGTRTVRIVKI
jgi:hypothetical protein